MSSFVVVTVANGRESLWAELALVGLLTGVDADVHLQVPSFVELLVAQLGLTGFGVCAHHLCADEILLLLFEILFLRLLFSFNLSEILLHKAVIVLSILLLIIKIFILVDVGETEIGQVVV